MISNPLVALLYMFFVGGIIMIALIAIGYLILKGIVILILHLML